MLSNWLSLLLGTAIFIESFLFLKIPEKISSLHVIVLKITKTIRSPRISDCWKEKILPAYAFKLFSASIYLFLLLMASSSGFFFLLTIDLFYTTGFRALLSSLSGIAFCSIFGVVYSYLRISSRKTSNNYTFGSKLLHRIVLSSPIISETLFDIEKSLHLKKCDCIRSKQHVFVAGLARAGTTVLMRTLYESGYFRSLTYRDMPFVLAPNIWQNISSKSKLDKTLSERAHGDGVLVDFDSPEALEEVFWRMRCGKEYIQSDRLIPMAADSDAISDFKDYVALILKDHNSCRYLSKNNNNILRLHTISQAFPESILLIPFREPVQQAYSLLKQHKKFTDLHSEDTFSRRYMDWLVHCEFGSGHKPFHFKGSTSAVAGDTYTLSYWLKIWLETYSYLFESIPQNGHFISYESLCDPKSKTYIHILEKINMEEYSGRSKLSLITHPIPKYLSKDLPLYLLEKVDVLYKKLSHISL